MYAPTYPWRATIFNDISFPFAKPLARLMLTHLILPYEVEGARPTPSDALVQMHLPGLPERTVHALCLHISSYLMR